MILYVQRNDRNNQTGMRNTISSLWDDPWVVAKRSAHVLDISSDAIYSHFVYQHSLLGKNLRVLFHCIGIDFEEKEDLDMVKQMTDIVFSHLAEQFQTIAVIRKEPDMAYNSLFLFNSVSVDGRRVFQDRNLTYTKIIDNLQSMTGQFINVKASSNVFFTNLDNNRLNYVPHGSCSQI